MIVRLWLVTNTHEVLEKTFSVAHETFHKTTIAISGLCLTTIKMTKNPLSLGIAEFENRIAETLHRQKAIQNERRRRQFICEREIEKEHKAFVPSSKFHEELDKEVLTYSLVQTSKINIYVWY